MDEDLRNPEDIEEEEDNIRRAITEEENKEPNEFKTLKEIVAERYKHSI